ncbi:hypothetical protein [Paraburkholderia youngii]|uniref:hypothetical protein n=1 Tax=Paraburkholderia youngii TaxID=2782701 RepID=UPI003D1CAFDF
MKETTDKSARNGPLERPVFALFRNQGEDSDSQKPLLAPPCAPSLPQKGYARYSRQTPAFMPQFSPISLSTHIRRTSSQAAPAKTSIENASQLRGN